MSITEILDPAVIYFLVIGVDTFCLNGNIHLLDLEMSEVFFLACVTQCVCGLWDFCFPDLCPSTSSLVLIMLVRHFKVQAKLCLGI